METDIFCVFSGSSKTFNNLVHQKEKVRSGEMGVIWYSNTVFEIESKFVSAMKFKLVMSF